MLNTTRLRGLHSRPCRLPAFLSEISLIPSGTKVACRLEQTISSATAEEGQQVQLAVTENVKVNDQIVITQGSACVGTIVLATAKRSMGRSGKLDFSIDKVRIGRRRLHSAALHHAEKIRRRQGTQHGCDDSGSGSALLAGRSFLPDPQRQGHQHQQRHRN